MKLKPVNDKIIVKPKPKEDEFKTESGIILPDSVQGGKLIEGEIIWEPIDPTGGSPIKIILKNGELDKGSFEEIMLQNQIELIDGLLYNISIDAYDRAKNRLSILLSDSVKYDITPPDFVNIAPEAGSYVNSAIVKFTNTEKLSSASVIE